MYKNELHEAKVIEVFDGGTFEEVGKEVVFLQSANKDSDNALTTAFEFQEARCQLLLLLLR